MFHSFSYNLTDSLYSVESCPDSATPKVSMDDGIQMVGRGVRMTMQCSSFAGVNLRRSSLLPISLSFLLLVVIALSKGEEASNEDTGERGERGEPIGDEATIRNVKLAV